jgi:hypothetical protein
MIVQGLLSLGIPVSAYIVIQQEQSLKDLSFISWIFFLLPVGMLVAWHFFRKGNTLAYVHSLAGTWILVGLLFFYWAYPLIDRKNPVVESLSVIQPLTSTHRLIGYKIFNPAFVFSLQQTVPLIQSKEELQVLAATGERIVIVTRLGYLGDFSSWPGMKIVYRKKDLFETSETVILAN